MGAKQFERQFELPSKIWETCHVEQGETSTPHNLDTSLPLSMTESSLPLGMKKTSPLIIGARCVINHINYKEMFNTYKATMDSGFDYCLFIPAVDYEKRQIALTDEQKTSVLQQIESNLDKINPATTNLLNIKANNIGHYKKDYLPDLKKSFICTSIMLRTNAFINYDGEVYLCQPLIGNLAYSIGNLNSQSFKELWNGPKHLSVIASLNEKFAKGNCENCRSIAYNKAIDAHLCGMNVASVPCDKFL